jgi:mycothiol system anti-sigma-R factor
MSDPCREFLSHLDDFLDGEVAEDLRPQVQAHLGECPPCLRRAHAEQALRAALRRSCSQGAAPAELRLRIRASIQMTAVEIRFRD